MSHDVSAPAWKTKIGNAAAKQVLVLLAEHSNSEGSCWPSRATIADRTELNERTVRRIFQVFIDIGLVEATKIQHKTYKEAFQLNLDMLGGDLREVFKTRWLLAQGRTFGDDAVCETETSPVCETASAVCETASPVCETAPLHPHIGGTVKEPLGNQPTPHPVLLRKPEMLAPVNHEVALTQACEAYRSTGMAAVASPLVCNAWQEAVAHVLAAKLCGDEREAVTLLVDRTKLFASYAVQFGNRDKKFIPKFATFLQECRFLEDDSRWKSSVKGSPAGDETSADGAAEAAWAWVLEYIANHTAEGLPRPGSVTARDSNNVPTDWAPDVPAPKADTRVGFALAKMAGSLRKGLRLVAETPADRLRFVRSEFLTAFAQTSELVA